MKNLLLSVCVLICLAGCKKNDDTQNSSNAHIFKGIVVTDEVGNALGTWGTEDGDWGTDANWSPSEYELLNFPDTISLDGTYIRDTTGWNIGPGIHEQPYNIVIAFPNPVKEYPILVYRGLGLLKFKTTIVDKYYNRLYTYACKDSAANIHLDFSDTIKFQSGTIYRMYYTLSTKDSLNFYKGHGDILICRESAHQDCQKYVP